MGLFDFMKAKEKAYSEVVPTAVTKINLVKEREQKVKISLEKKTKEQIITKVNFCIDVSGSMSAMFSSGLVQDILERIYPVASSFDDDKEMDMWLFSCSYRSLPVVKLDNFASYIQKEVVERNYLGGGTNYAPVLKDIVSKNKDSKIPVYTIFITDGDNDDKCETTRVIRDASKYPIFFQFVGIGHARFQFLEELDTMVGRIVDNANFFQLNDIASVSDEKLYDRLLNEFPSWIKDARNNNIIK